MKITDIILEASSPAQQAAIAINMKKHGKKPKHVDEAGENLEELNTKTLKSYVGKRLARNPNVMAANTVGKVKKQRAGIDLAMDKIIPGSAIRKPKIASTEDVEIIPEADATDTVSMDIPLLLRMMEYAREDAKSDEDLHDVAEKMIELSKHHDYLCMDNYNEIVGSAAHDDMNEAAKKKGPKPTNPALWSRAKAAARAKYDVYPSAYANGYAAKWYKEHGGGWRGK